MQLRRYLNETKTTARAFAQALRVSEAAVSRYCAGRTPRAAIADRIADLTEGRVTANDFHRPARYLVSDDFARQFISNVRALGEGAPK